MDIIDFQKPPVNTNQLQQIDKEYSKLEKPILVHCSAGQDRTGYTIDFLKHKYIESLPN